MTKWEHIKHKIVSREEAETIIKSWKNSEEKVIFTNGCFDILHRGHITYLAKAASMGEYLVVGLNSDKSIKRLEKGKNRPINEETSRTLLLAALEVVDLVVVFEENNPKELIKAFQPDVLVKGADYDAEETRESNPKYIVGAKEVRHYGGEIVTIALEEGFSTTSIIEKIKGSSKN